MDRLEHRSKTTDIGEKSVPVGGVQGTNDFGKRNYSGPCPPSGTHRYFFKIFALDSRLDLKASARRAELDAAMKSHVLTQDELIARSSRRVGSGIARSVISILMTALSSHD